MRNSVLILTGEKQSGKTTFLKNWVDVQPNVAGILTPVVAEKRCFYDIIEKSFFDMEVAYNMLPTSQILNVGKYYFSLPSFNRAAETLMYCCVNSNVDYLVIDEIGPLELNQHKGFYEALLYVVQNIDPAICLIIVARLACIAPLQTLLQLFNHPSRVLSIEELKKELSDEFFGIE